MQITVECAECSKEFELTIPRDLPAQMRLRNAGTLSGVTCSHCGGELDLETLDLSETVNSKAKEKSPAKSKKCKKKASERLATPPDPNFEYGVGGAK